MAKEKLPVAVIGATGLAGQQFLTALVDHPWFQITRVAASHRSAGKPLGDALKAPDGSSRWGAQQPPPGSLMGLTVEDASELDPSGLAAVFTAIESDAARDVEPRLAAQVPVLSTASAFRYEDDVPILMPAVNPGHAELLRTQQEKRGWKGYIAPGPNCTTVGLAHTLAPLDSAFGLQSVVMTSMQAVSGAGRSPGVAALDIVDNIIPFIPSEEDKVEKETRKILGTLTDDGVVAHPARISCTCTRVPVIEGHTEAVFASLKKAPSAQEAADALDRFCSDRADLDLPSTPPAWTPVSVDPYRPQPRLDRDNHGGMATTVGRMRVDPVVSGVKYVLVSHNTQMGAAKGAILTAEFLHKQGYLG